MEAFMTRSHLFARALAAIAFVAFTESMIPSAQAQSEVLTIAAANNLKDVFRKILPIFEAQNRDITVRVIYAPPKTLAKQIEEGAPVDVFLPALFEDIDQLESKELILKESKHVYARTALVLITNSAFPAQLDSIQDLETKPVRRIAIGDPAASAVGKDTIEFLKHRNLESRLKSQFIYGEHSRAVLDFVSKGEAELGIVYRTDAIGSKRVRIIDSVPSDSHKPITYGVVSPWTARNISGARDFVSFLQAEKAQGELKQYGFEPVVVDVSLTQRQEVKP
jgi:molybdate transport system substrate-binding protein